MTTRVFTLAQNVISPFSLSSVSRKSCIRRSRRLTAENTLPAPRTLAPQDLEPRLRPESGILCFNRSISGGFDRLRHVKTLLPFVRTFLKGPPTGLRKLFKNPRAKPGGTKMFCSAFLNDARMCCFFANAIVKY